VAENNALHINHIRRVQRTCLAPDKRVLGGCTITLIANFPNTQTSRISLKQVQKPLY